MKFSKPHSDKASRKALKYVTQQGKFIPFHYLVGGFGIAEAEVEEIIRWREPAQLYTERWNQRKVVLEVHRNQTQVLLHRRPRWRKYHVSNTILPFFFSQKYSLSIFFTHGFRSFYAQYYLMVAFHEYFSSIQV